MSNFATTPNELTQYLRDYPKDPKENLAWRRKLLYGCKNSPEFKAKVKELFHRDILFAFNAFFFTLDVRKRPLHNQPFCTYPFQDHTILALADAITSGKDLPLEKSRDMGASWMVILTFFWFWLDPKGGADFLLGSRIEDYVDKKGDMRTLMQKARYALYKLPLFLRPKGFNMKKHDNFMRLFNPETGATITGESNNPNFSTGGRYLAILYDEFAKWETTDKAAWTAGGDATPSRIPVSTPFGAAGQYYELVTEGKEKIRLHWSLHPDKAEGLYCVWPKPQEADDTVDWEHTVGLRSPWYDFQCQRRSPLEVAQELDIDYVGAGNPVFDGRAGKRISLLLKSQKTPQAFYRIDLEGEKLDPIPNSDFWENLVVIWEQPLSSAVYCIACDVAEGKEHGDFSIIQVVNRDTKSIAASFFSRYDETYISLVMKLVWDLYTTTFDRPWWAVETTGLGLSVFDQCVIQHQMSNAFMMPIYDKSKEAPTYRKGWWTSTSSRNVLISGIKEWLVEGAGWVPPRTVRELTTFVRDKNGKPGAKNGCNDDEVMCFGIALQVDQRCPLPDRTTPKKPNEFGLTEDPFSHFPSLEEPTVEQRCMNQALERLAESHVHLHPLTDYLP